MNGSIKRPRSLIWSKYILEAPINDRQYLIVGSHGILENGSNGKEMMILIIMKNFIFSWKILKIN